MWCVVLCLCGGRGGACVETHVGLRLEVCVGGERGVMCCVCLCVCTSSPQRMLCTQTCSHSTSTNLTHTYACTYPHTHTHSLTTTPMHTLHTLPHQNHPHRDRLHIKPEENAVLFTEPTHNSKEVREKMVQTAFEHLRCVWDCGWCVSLGTRGGGYAHGGGRGCVSGRGERGVGGRGGEGGHHDPACLGSEMCGLKGGERGVVEGAGMQAP